MAFKVSVHRWQGEKRLQLEVKALRPHCETIALSRGERTYKATRHGSEGLQLSNALGQRIHATAFSEKELSSDNPLSDHPMVRQLLEEACLGLGLRP